MSWDEIKDEKEGYVRVRKSDDRALIGRLKKENDDPEAKGYIELNKEDLGGMGGSGGPHSHSEYAPKTHAHDDKADVNHTHDTTHDHFGQYAGKAEFDAHHHDTEYQPVGNYADANHTHDGIDGESYDDSWIQPALDAKSSKSHTHDADYAGATHGHDEFMVLQNQINDKADENHVHDAVQAFDPTYLEEKNDEEDARLDVLETSQAEQDARLDALEAQAHEHDGCGNVLGHFMNTWNTSANGGADARDYNIKLHKPANIKGGEGGDLDDVDVWETTENLQAGDIVYFKVGDDVYEREFSRRMALQYYYDLSFTEKVDFIPKDAEFFIMDSPECEEEIPEHDHEGMVVSESVTTIVRLTEAEYNALADKDPSTLYLVV